MNFIQSFKKNLGQIFKLSFGVSLFALSALSFSVMNLNACGLNACGLNTRAASKESHNRFSHKENCKKLGERLTNQFWLAVQKQKTRQFSNMIAPICQQLSPTGVQTSQEIIDGLTGANLNGFETTNFVATCHDDNILVVSYDLIASQGSSIVSGPTLNTWKRSKDDRWKMITTAYVPFLLN